MVSQTSKTPKYNINTALMYEYIDEPDFKKLSELI